MKLTNLPEASGVYIFKEENGKPIYVGKSLNIKTRVKNHLNTKLISQKAKILRDRSTSIEVIQVDSEIEALNLEANLIKKFKPYLNSQLKDDKDYLYIKITDDFFPKVLTARKKDLKDAKTYFGPYPSAKRVRSTLKTLRRIFPYSTCSPNQKRPCLYYHIGLCPGVCAGKASEKEYRKDVRKLRLFLQGKKMKVFDVLERELGEVTSKLQFEEAAKIRDQLESLRYITKAIRGVDLLEENLEETRNIELKELALVVGMNKNPERIECYDISNIFGKEAVGSMVVFTNGLAEKSEYKRFKIKDTTGINDIAMLCEVLSRRFRHEWSKPDLIVIDGGRGQLNGAVKVLVEEGLNIPVISLAKRLEEIYLYRKEKPVRLPRSSNALRLLQRVRDEAHRFAIYYHRKLRRKQLLTTSQ